MCNTVKGEKLNIVASIEECVGLGLQGIMGNVFKDRCYWTPAVLTRCCNAISYFVVVFKACSNSG